MDATGEKFDACCREATQMMREHKLGDAFKAARRAFDLAAEMARFAASEERPKWIARAEDALAVAEGIDAALHPAGKPVSSEGSSEGEAMDEVIGTLTLGTRPKERLSDVCGMEQAKDEIRLSVIEPIKNPEKARKYGLKLGGGLLLYGLPGTGKTFFAKAVAGELDLPFFVIRSSDILNKYLGESEKIIRGVFEAARKNPMSVIFIDETNGLLPSRGEDGTHAVSQRVAEIILEETDGIDSKEKNPFLLIGATNYPNKIDDAALSRFTTCIEVELPAEATRRFILKRELGQMTISVDGEALDYLAGRTQGFSSRDMVNLVTYLRKCAAKESIEVFSKTFAERNFQDNHVTSVAIAKGIEEFRHRIGVADKDEKKK